jgi:hypothetical protein
VVAAEGLGIYEETYQFSVQILAIPKTPEEIEATNVDLKIG